MTEQISVRVRRKSRATITSLFDAGSFVEHEASSDSSCIVGEGAIDGRKTYLVAEAPYAEVPKDFATLHAKKLRLLERIGRDPRPLVVFADAFRLYRPEGMFIATPGFPEFILGKTCGSAYLRELGRLSGVVPIVSVLVGDVIAGGTISPALCDTYVMIRRYRMTFARTDLYRKMTGDDTGAASLGNAEMHCATSGAGDALVDDEREAVSWVRRYLSYLPPHFRALPPEDRSVSRAPDPDEIATFDIAPNVAFDVRRLVRAVTDAGSFLEYKALYAREVVTGFARVDGIPIGVIANNSKARCGAIYPESCKKIAKFASLCDAFSVPLVILADTPGFMVGVGLDEGGAIKNAALVSSVLARVQAPKLLVIVRNAFGGGIFMSGPGLADAVVAFPNAKVGPFGGVTIREPESHYEAEALREMRDMADMRCMLERGLLDAIVEPARLREYLVRFLESRERTPRTVPSPVLCIG